MKNRYVLCEVSDDSFKEFVEAFYESGKGDFYLDIASGGGDSQAMMSFHDFIVTSPKRIVGTAIGTCQSAAVLILAACHHRLSTPYTTFMVHEDSYTVDDDHGTIKQTVLAQEQAEDLWAALMEMHTGTEAFMWREDARATSFFIPDTAVRYGLVDGIVYPTLKRIKRKVI